MDWEKYPKSRKSIRIKQYKQYQNLNKASAASTNHGQGHNLTSGILPGFQGVSDPLPLFDISWVLLYIHVWGDARRDIQCVSLYIHTTIYHISGWFSNVWTFTHTCPMTRHRDRVKIEKTVRILDLCLLCSYMVYTCIYHVYRGMSHVFT